MVIRNTIITYHMNVQKRVVQAQLNKAQQTSKNYDMRHTAYLPETEAYTLTPHSRY